LETGRSKREMGKKMVGGTNILPKSLCFQVFSEKTKERGME
jgi:hypothetical protein